MTLATLIKRIVSSIVMLFSFLYMILIGNVIFRAEFNIISIDTAKVMIMMLLALTSGTMLYNATLDSQLEKQRFIKRLGYLLFVFYSVVLVGILFYNVNRLSGLPVKEAYRHINLVPFFTIKNYIKALENNRINDSVFVFNIVGNLFLFMPLGMMGLIKIKSLNRFSNYLFCIAMFLLVIECIQFTTGTGAFDIDDIILNGIGLIGCWKIWQSKWLKSFIHNLEKKEMEGEAIEEGAK